MPFILYSLLSNDLKQSDIYFLRVLDNFLELIPFAYFNQPEVPA